MNRAAIFPMLAMLLILSTGNGESATYYIDYASGDDGNDGTSMETPWKSAPGMNLFSGKVQPAPGDRFIFKGGVRWPATCFQWKITKGGSGEDARVYYGADPTWYSGDTFSRPVFDFEHTIIGIGGWMYGAGILVQGCSYNTFDDLDVANHRAPLAQNGIGTWGTCSITFDNSGYNIVTNCVVRDWDMPTPIVPGTSGGGGIMRVNNGSRNVVTHSEFHQQNVSVKSGTSLWNIYQVDHCHIHNTPTAVMSAQIVHHNYIHDLAVPDDSAAHSNVMLCNGGLVAFNNVIHDIPPVAQVIFIAPGYYGPGSDLIYNNLVYNVAQPCVAIDTDGMNHPTSASRIYNNTFIAPFRGHCIRVGYRANGNLPLLDLRNNHLVSDGRPILYNNPAGGGGIVNSLTAVAQLSQSYAEAEAAGYTAANQYAPTRSGSPTVRTGVDLSEMFPSDATDIAGRSRPAGAWDVGAYQYGGSVPVVSPRLARQP